MTQPTLLVLSVLSLALTGCAAKPAAEPVAQRRNDAPQGPVIVRLVGQHQAVTVTSGPSGPLYSAETIEGKVIVANATLEQLRQEHPETYQFIEPGVAQARGEPMPMTGTVETTGPRPFTGPLQFSSPDASDRFIHAGR